MSRLLPRVAFWLVPERRSRETLQQRINALAVRFNAPMFMPHLTLYSCQRTPDQAELRVMAALAAKTAPIRLSVAEVATSEQLAKTLFLRFSENATLRSMYDTFHMGVPQPSNYQLEPHLSLLYQQLPPNERAELVVRLRWPRQEICLDELRAVAIPQKLTGLQDFSGWETLFAARLQD